MRLSNSSASIAACLLLSALFGPAVAQTASTIRVTDTFNWSTPSPDPTGVVFIPGANALFVTDSEVEETVLFNGSNMFQTELDGSLVELFSTLDFTPEPTGITINPNNNHLFISMDDAPRLIFEIDPGPDGRYLNIDDTITSFRTTEFNCYDAEGVTYNPVDDVLHIACGVANIIYTIDPGPNGLFDGVAPVGDDTVSSFDTSILGLNDPEGIAYDSESGALYVIGKPKSQLLHVSTDGQFIRTITLDSSLLYKPAGLALGPSSLNNGAQSLYVVDRGVDNDSNPAENDGRLFEFALPSQTSNTAPTIQISAPADGEVYQTGDSISFAAVATDLEDGDLSSAVTWHSDIDGALGSGAAFSTSSLSIGLHTITATCVDSSLTQALDVIQLRVLSPGSIIVETRIDSSSDDAEQRGPGGNTWTDGNDLELIDDNSVAQIVGLRFNALSIPAGAVIEEAFIQFQADEAQSSPTLLEIRAQASDNAEAIQGKKNNLTNRNTTAASSNWQPDDWLVIGEAGPSQKTADLSAVVQEVVNRPGWNEGNSMAFLITGSSTTRRTAESFDSEPDAAPLLHIRYTLSSQIPALTITSPLDGSVSDDASVVSLSATATDPQEGNLAAQVSWTSNLDGVLGSGATDVILTQGLHTITATVSDADGNTASDSVTVQVDSASEPGSLIVEARINSSNDDAEQRGPGGNTWIDGDDLELVYDASIAQIVGLRFNTLSIPNGALIDEAYIQFQADEAKSSPILMEIRAQASDDAEPIQARKNNLTNRSTTLASSSWQPADWTVVGEAGPNQKTTDLSAVVQEVVNRPGWNTGNSMAFLITGSSTTRRTAESFDGEPGAAPLLHIRYTLSSQIPALTITSPLDGSVSDDASVVSLSATATDPQEGNLAAQVSWTSNLDGVLGSGATDVILTQGLHTITATVSDADGNTASDSVTVQVDSASEPGSLIVEARINSSNDDAEQRGPGGNTWTDGNDLELIYDNSVAQIVGLRFNALSIPAGAVIEQAYIQFQADEAQSSPTLLEIRAQASDNAEAIQGRKNNLTNRATTAASSNWQPDDWLVIGEAGPSQKTADLSTVVQEVVNRPGWNAGNAMAFLITGSSTTRRTAESFDSEPDAAPLLHIRYTNAPQASKVALKSAANDNTSAPETSESPGAATGDMTTGKSDDQSDVKPSAATADATTLNVLINHDSDDAGEYDDGLVNPGSRALELAVDGDQHQQIGLRFNAVQIPRDAGILSAYVQFQAADTADELAFLTITAQDSDNAGTFNALDYNISSRPRTAASVTWLPPAWPTSGTAGPDQRTPNLSTLLQKVITRDNWTAGNSIVILVEGDGNRLAEAIEGQKDAAPELTVIFTTQNAAPSVNAGPDQHIAVSGSAVLNGIVSDDGLPAVPGPIDLQWTVISGPGSVGLSDPKSLATNASFNGAGTYQLLLTATDGQLTAFDEITINVSPTER